VTGCASPELPSYPPLVHNAKRELEQPRHSSSPEVLLHEPRLAGCYTVTLIHSGGSFPYASIPDVLELTTNDSPRCCGPGAGWYSVGWNEDSRAQFLGGQWSEATNGNVHVTFGYGGTLEFRLRRAGARLAGSATNDSPNRGHDKVHPPVTLSPTSCQGRKFLYEPVWSGY
jgi:hypothetical protein